MRNAIAAAIFALALVPASAAASGAAPLTDDVAGRVTAAVRLNGQGPFDLILDTGANRTVLTPENARLLGLSGVGAAPVTGLADLAVAARVRIAHLDAGAFVRADVPAIVMDGFALGEADGILGADAFAGRRLVIDFARDAYRLEDGGAAAPEGFATVRGELRNGLLVAEVLVNGLPTKALIDTGAERSFVNPALIARLELVARRTGARAAGVEQEAEAALARLAHIALGGFDAGAVEAYVTPLALFRDMRGVEEPGLVIGMDVLRRADLVAIDYARAELQLRRRAPV